MMGFKEKWLCAITIMFMFDFQVVYGCLEQERVALLHLKAEFNNPPPLVSSWKEDNQSDCCENWDGVVCGADGRVFSLSLSSFHLHREFNASVLLPLEQLRELHLYSNSITGWTEAKGAKKLSTSLTKLELLDLANNLLDGKILPQLSGFQSLTQLYLWGNNIRGMIPLSDIEAFKNLKALVLNFNAIDGFISHDHDSVKPSSSLTKLEELDLGYNKLNKSILPQLSRFQSLKRLYLSDNQLGGVIPLNAFEAFNNLEALDLSLNGINHVISQNDSLKLSSTLPKLRTLYLEDNHLDSSVLPHLWALPSLASLDLTGNQIGGLIRLNDFEGFKNLKQLSLESNVIDGITTDGWTNSSKLELLDLSHNDFTQDIPSCLQNLTSLQQVDLSYNSFHGELPWWLSSWTSLQALNLSHNQFTGDVAKSPLVYLQSLRVLKLSNNRFQIPLSFKSFANHTKLKAFVADSNQAIMDESEPDVHPFAPGLKLRVLTLSRCSIDASLLNLLQHHHDLRLLELSHNPLQVTFPAWLLENNPLLDVLPLQNSSLVGPMQLPTRPHAYVRLINLSYNKIQGDIPANISTLLPRLSWLDMSNNELKGSIPSSLCIHILSVLILRNNRLCGGLGPLTQGCFNLSTLDLSNNNLQGEIPSLYGLPHITHLLLSGNNLSGSIKDEIFYSPWSLESLVLSNNSLEGPVPKWLCRFQNLWLLDLSYNMINGSMPSCLMRLPEIEYLYLSNNQLSGPMKDTIITNTSGLVLLDLSNNDLTGHIPSCIGDIPYLRVLLLGGNNFIGDIHFQLCNLLYLTMLDLSHNNISGTIPICLIHISFHALQDEGPTDLAVSSFLSSFGLYEDQDVELAMGLGSYVDILEVQWEVWVNFTTKGISYDYEGNILQNMSGINLSYNRLLGEIPKEMGNLTQLRALNLSHNQLTGPIPATFSNMGQLESLDLSCNHLSGSIPIELTEMNALGTFKVGHNNLSGKIPFEAHLVTFNQGSYEGNPLLCGPPLLKSCIHGEWHPIESNASTDDVMNQDDGLIDMDAFYVTFTVTSIVMFLATVLIMWINPHWQAALYYLAKLGITSSYYFLEDVIRKLWSVIQKCLKHFLDY